MRCLYISKVLIQPDVVNNKLWSPLKNEEDIFPSFSYLDMDICQLLMYLDDIFSIGQTLQLIIFI